MEEILIENLSFRYNQEWVIRNAHFHIKEGSFTSFIGPNGGGKSTMAKLLLGLLVPQEGHISIFGKPPAQSKHLIGYVPQFSQYDITFPVTVQDVILMGRLKKGLSFYNKTDRRDALDVIKQLGLKGLEGRSLETLSGGQRQRVLIGRALMTRPRILLMDEPTASVDPHSQKQLYQLMLELNKERTIILISHDLDFVAANVDKVICFDSNVAIHPTDELTPENCRIYGQNARIVRHSTTLEEIHHE